MNTLIKRVEGLQGQMDGFVKSACQRREVWIVKANKEQLKSGMNADGELMNEGYYSPMTVKQRAKRGLPADHVYLSFEGDLQEGMKVEFGETGFAVVTTDWKQRLVEESMRTGYWPASGFAAPHYGRVFGLDAAHKAELARLIAPAVAKRIRTKLK